MKEDRRLFSERGIQGVEGAATNNGTGDAPKRPSRRCSPRVVKSMFHLLLIHYGNRTNGWKRGDAKSCALLQHSAILTTNLYLLQKMNDSGVKGVWPQEEHHIFRSGELAVMVSHFDGKKTPHRCDYLLVRVIFCKPQQKARLLGGFEFYQSLFERCALPEENFFTAATGGPESDRIELDEAARHLLALGRILGEVGERWKTLKPTNGQNGQ